MVMFNSYVKLPECKCSILPIYSYLLCQACQDYLHFLFNVSLHGKFWGFAHFSSSASDSHPVTVGIRVQLSFFLLWLWLVASREHSFNLRRCFYGILLRILKHSVGDSYVLGFGTGALCIEDIFSYCPAQSGSSLFQIQYHKLGCKVVLTNPLCESITTRSQIGWRSENGPWCHCMASDSENEWKWEMPLDWHL